jgi:hypothetical protein
MVSMVKNARGTDPKPARADALIEAIKNGKYKKEVENIRAVFSHALETSNGDHVAAKKAVDPLKKELPAVQWSGIFTGRGDDALASYSGLLCADLDNLDASEAIEARQKLTDDPHVYALFTSPTGTGLKVVFAVEPDPEKHLGNFLAVKQHVLAVCGLAVDESCKNPERLCFVSFDPQAYLNPDAVPLAAIAEQAKRTPAPVFSGPVDLSARQRIAVELLGAIDWTSQTRGFVDCPGRGLHTAGDGKKDCEIHLDRVPSVHCLHQHCGGIVAGVNHELRSRVAKAESTKQTPYRRGGGAAEYLDSGGDEPEEQDPATSASAWPAPLAPEAFYGLAGDVVRTIEPHSEADPAALLVMLLAACGNLVGPCAHFIAEARKHFCRVWPVLVGETAKGRKGSAWSSLRYVLAMVDEVWRLCR